MQTRPETCSVDRFFLRYSKGKCIQQAVGINKFGSMPRNIAEFLNLPDAKDFTGHSLRRTSATLLVDAGADLTTSQRHGGWKSATVAFGYDADSINNKKRICDQISSGIDIQKRAKTTNFVPGTVGQLDHGASTSGVNTTLRLKENQAITPETATTSILKRIQNSKISISSTLKPNRDANVSKTDENINYSISGDCNHGSSKETCEVQPREPKFPCFYHPDIGLYIECSTNQDAPPQNCIFNNCNVHITGSNNTFIFNNCNVEHEAVQTESNVKKL